MDSANSCIVNFVSWNMKSLSHPEKRKKGLNHVQQLKVDIVFLHEMHLRTCWANPTTSVLVLVIKILKVPSKSIFLQNSSFHIN